ncbi:MULTISPECIES: acyltransferase family protein [Microbacterium]|uniref:Fucose 4-O-acetylase n=1 Tax=Microbacterium wangchenii TaxID=2541726 RepID=A0ABX5SQ73_9MICO|nr:MULTISPECIES: acyltransferase family protein [Microbacterium]MCK6066998.1 acyltransferase family protein [Microbacterium sp. EYE_512]QBR88293.1 fucose 4-O-acetylase [Microbacterium wangchenii]
MSDATAPGGADPTTGGTAAVRPRRRVHFWDNARFACIVLVVLGHAVQRLTYDSDIALGMYLLVYAFHMPAFALISGYFSKAGTPTRPQMARVLTDILVPYAIFEALWTLTKWLVEGQANPNPTQPSWTLWFLVALGIFRVVLPYLALLRWPLLWTVVISVGVGYLPNIDSTFALTRTLGLLPFFTLGWWLRENDIVERLGLLRRRPWWVIAGSVATFAAAALACWYFVDVWRDVDLRAWLFYDTAYGEMVGPQWWAGGVRMLLLVVALILCTAFFALLPRRQTWWTQFGQYTMYVYLLHSFVLYPFRESGILRDAEPTWLWLPLVVVASVLIALALATRPVRRVFRPLIEPRPGWLFADPTLASREGRRNDPTGSRRPRDGATREKASGPGDR